MKTILTLVLTVAILLAAGTTAVMAKTAMHSSDLAPGAYHSDVNKNVLTINKDNTFKFETPGKVITGTLKKQSITQYIGLYTDPKTKKQVPKMFTYDPVTKSIKIQGEGGIVYKMK